MIPAISFITQAVSHLSNAGTCYYESYARNTCRTVAAQLPHSSRAAAAQFPLVFYTLF